MKKRTERRRQGLVAHQSYEGPLPPPKFFEQYEQVLPGAAERMMSSAEKQNDHRIRQEDRMIRHACRTETVGQVCAVAVSAGAIYAATIVTNPWVAAALIGTPLVSIVKLFIQKRAPNGS